MADMNEVAAPRKEIYTYAAPWTVFAMAWSRRYVLFVPICLLRDPIIVSLFANWARQL